MKILQVISFGYPGGGAEKSVQLIKENLIKRGHKVLIVSSNHNPDAVHFSDIEFPEIDQNGLGLIEKFFKHIWYVESYRIIKKTVNEFKPDVVHFHTMGQLSPSAIFAIGKTPGILTVHGPEEYVSSLLEWSFPSRMFHDAQVDLKNLTVLGRLYYIYYRFLQKPFYMFAFRRKLKLIIAPSKYMERVLKKENYKVDILQLYNGIKLPQATQLINNKRILYVGRLEHVKGVQVLLSAMREVISNCNDVLLEIVGDGKMRPDLEDLAAKYNLTSNVKFIGWLNQTDVLKKYKDVYVVVIPSIWPENLPTVCIEALASGRPVIGTDTGGIPELIRDGVTGVIVPKNNVDRLSKALIDQLAMQNVKDLSIVCASSMRKFSIEMFIDNLEENYKKIIGV
jgi:glycosyltransferase involved in cell wall biosynthesis